MIEKCGAQGCEQPATVVVVIRDHPGHVHDCGDHAASLAMHCDVVDTHLMPCPLVCSPVLYETTPPAVR